MSKLKTITLGELKAQLACIWELADDTKLTFGGGRLSFHRPKTYLTKPDGKTPVIVDIEFNELYEITLDSDAAA